MTNLWREYPTKFIVDEQFDYKKLKKKILPPQALKDRSLLVFLRLS